MLERLRMEHLCFLQERKKQKRFGESAILGKPLGSWQLNPCIIAVLCMDQATLPEQVLSSGSSASHAADRDMETSFFKWQQYISWNLFSFNKLKGIFVCSQTASRCFTLYLPQQYNREYATLGNLYPFLLCLIQNSPLGVWVYTWEWTGSLGCCFPFVFFWGEYVLSGGCQGSPTLQPTGCMGTGSGGGSYWPLDLGWEVQDVS